MRKGMGGSWICTTMLAATACLSLGHAWAQETKAKDQEKAQEAKAEWPCNLDYHLNVVTLGTNSKEMYWKQDDCIRILLENNPFIYNYAVDIREDATPEDDIIGSIGKALGLPQPSDVNTTKSADHSGADQNAAKKDVADLASKVTQPIAAIRDQVPGPAFKYEINQALNQYQTKVQEDVAIEKGVSGPNAFGELEANVKHATSTTSLGADTTKKLTSLMESSLPECEITPDNVAVWRSQAKKLDEDANTIAIGLKAKEDAYRQFWRDAKWRDLTDQGADPLEIERRARQLRVEVENLARQLGPDTLGSPGDSGSGLESRFVEFARSASVLHPQLLKARDCNRVKNLHTLSDADSLLDQVDNAGMQVVLAACKYKAKRDSNFSALETGLLAPLESALNNPLAFRWNYTKREGPFQDPTSVHVALKRAPVETAIGISLPEDSTPYDCFGDPTEMFDTGGFYRTFDDFFTHDPLSPGPQSKESKISPKPAKGTPKTVGSTSAKGSPDKPKANTDITTVVLEQPWVFGGARTIVSGGLTIGFLRKQEFQRSNSIVAGQSQPVIGLKTNSALRLTPMLYGNVRLFAENRHSPEAWYATLGVTANSDNKGTSPEFLLGLSRSFAQQKFFLTAGTYIGQQQKLDGGLQVGQIIPSALTGELPVTKSYRAGFAFSLSYRFVTSKAPQKDAAPAKAGANTPK